MVARRGGFVPFERARRIGGGADAMLQEKAERVLGFELTAFCGALDQAQGLARVARHAAALVGANAEDVLGFRVAFFRAREKLVERRVLRRCGQRAARDERGGNRSNERYSTVIRPSLITFDHLRASLLM